MTKLNGCHIFLNFISFLKEAIRSEIRYSMLQVKMEIFACGDRAIAARLIPDR